MRGMRFRWLNRMQTKRPSTLLILDAVEEQEGGVWEGAVVLELRHAEQRRKNDHDAYFDNHIHCGPQKSVI
jgi:hypothetical protein